MSVGVVQVCPGKPETALDSLRLELQLSGAGNRTELLYKSFVCLHTEPSSGSYGFGLAKASNLLGKGKDISAGLCEGDTLSFARNTS